MAKWFATEAAGRVCDRAVQLFGGRGVTRGEIVERLYRDVRALRIYEGASEIQQLRHRKAALGNVRGRTGRIRKKMTWVITEDSAMIYRIASLVALLLCCAQCAGRGRQTRKPGNSAQRGARCIRSVPLCRRWKVVAVRARRLEPAAVGRPKLRRECARARQSWESVLWPTVT